MRKIELLVPASSLEVLKIAVILSGSQATVKAFNKVYCNHLKTESTLF